MNTTVDALILDLLDWIGPDPRPYSEVIEAWRTSCPRLPVWEEANERGFVERSHARGEGAYVFVSALGREFLGKHRPVPGPEDVAFSGPSGCSSPRRKPLHPRAKADQHRPKPGRGHRGIRLQGEV